jgi:hypothetical protein
VVQASQTESFTIQEAVQPGTSVEVSTTVNLNGKLAEHKPGAKTPISTLIRAASQAHYRERTLAVTDTGDVTKVARRYWDTAVEKQVGEAKQTIKLRADAERIAIERIEFDNTILCPDGALTAPELALLDAEPFVPALRGLLPTKPIRIGDQWQATEVAASELTGVAPIQSGALRCTFQEVKTTDAATVARIKFSGILTGPTEQGPASMTVDGHLLFDLDQQMISSVVMNGRTDLFESTGQSAGTLEGRYELTRRPAIDDPRLTDSALEGHLLKPSRESTALLFDGKTVGIQFLYPRNWELQSFTKSAVQLKEPTGGDLRLAIDSNPAPRAEKLRTDLVTWLKGQKAIVRGDAAIQSESLSETRRLERFSVQAEHDKTDKEWTYLVITDGGRSVVVACNLLQKRADTLREDIQFLAQSVKFVDK